MKQCPDPYKNVITLSGAVLFNIRMLPNAHTETLKNYWNPDEMLKSSSWVTQRQHFFFKE